MHAVSATSTKVSMYRIFTRTAVRLLPRREVRKGTQRMCACAFYVKLPGFRNTEGRRNPHSTISAVCNARQTDNIDKKIPFLIKVCCSLRV